MISKRMLPLFNILMGMTLCSVVLLTGCQNLSNTTASAMVTPLADASAIDLTNAKPHRSIVDKPKIALVLGSGGARGYAHIGVIKVLEQQGIHPDMIVATSAGSIVGAMYASGQTAQQLEQMALHLKTSDVREFTFTRKGFLDGAKIEAFINKQVHDKPLEKLTIPMYVVATELSTGKAIVFAKGNTGQAVRASVSIPTMFVPTKIGHIEYVDGGLVSPVPVEIARQLGADVVIAVDILAQPEHTTTQNYWGLFNQNINVMQNRLAAYELAQADVVIQPDIREKAHIFDTKSRSQTIQAGVDAAQQQIGTMQLALQRQGLKPVLNSQAALVIYRVEDAKNSSQ